MKATVRQYMQPNVITIGSGETLLALQRLLTEKRINGVPVVDDGRLVGVVSRTDVLQSLVDEDGEAELMADYYRESGWPETTARRLGERDVETQQERKVAEVMSTKLLTISKDASVAEAARLMLEHRVHRLPVTEGDALVGVLSSQDLLRVVAQQ